MEEEARQILKSGLAAKPVSSTNLADAIRSRIEPLGGVELVIAPRELMRQPPKFDK